MKRHLRDWMFARKYISERDAFNGLLLCLPHIMPEGKTVQIE